MTSPREQSDNRTLIVAFLAIVILALSLHLLVMTENSLEEGRGPPGSALTATLPMMVVIVAIIALMSRDGKSSPTATSSVNLQIAALMAAMFVLGMVIEPALPRPSGPPGGDAMGVLLLLIPVFLIITMLRPNHSVSVDEEE
jgi:cytochrome bd-type quinol oxidase subunit 2